MYLGAVPSGGLALSAAAVGLPKQKKNKNKKNNV